MLFFWVLDVDEYSVTKSVGRSVCSAQLDLENAGFGKCLHCRTCGALFSFVVQEGATEMFAKCMYPWKACIEGNLTRLMLLGQKVKTGP